MIGYLQDFLFSPDRARTPLKALSGGEHNRVLLAQLFAQPANLLVLDEPTNDLDIETLELLEELLVDYRGTLLLVSHDRAFLDNVVTLDAGVRGRRPHPGVRGWILGLAAPPRPATRPDVAAAVKAAKPVAARGEEAREARLQGGARARGGAREASKRLETEHRASWSPRLSQPDLLQEATPTEQARVHARVAALSAANTRPDPPLTEAEERRLGYLRACGGRLTRPQPLQSSWRAVEEALWRYYPHLAQSGGKCSTQRSREWRARKRRERRQANRPVSGLDK